MSNHWLKSLNRVSKSIKKEKYCGNIDETEIWIDMPSREKTVPIVGTRHEKSRIIVCLSALDLGRKHLALVIFKGTNIPVELKEIS
ncbi:hypothetical protein HZS_3330 [Henneguya salminicola]|nr:hypothetical protein HZS_3330 [Henneguya salminicola]